MANIVNLTSTRFGLSGGFFPSAGGSNSAPSWYTSLTKGQWKAVSGGTGYGATFQNGPRIQDAASTLGYVPGSSFSGQGAAPAYHNITAAWCGMTVDQSRGMPIMLANGGHNDYGGNEGYAWFKSPPGGGPPGWYRFIDPTPESSMLFNTGNAGVGALYQDNRPRSMHTGPSYIWADNKIWLGYQGPYFSPGGSSVECQFSFDMQNSGVVAALANATSLAWDGTIGPWTNLGAAYTDSVGYGYYSPSVYDSVNKIVWWGTGFGFDRSTTIVWNMHTSGGSIGTGTTYTLNGGNPYADFTWAICASDLGLIVMGDASIQQKIVVFEIAQTGGAQGTWYYSPGNDAGAGSVTGTGYFGTADQTWPWAVYQQIDHSILIMDPVFLGNTMYKLKIPMSGGSYDKTGTWQWSNFTTSGDTLVFFDSNPFGTRTSDKTMSKFNIINDMGDGSSALFYCGGIGDEGTNLGGVQGAASFNIPSYIMPLPSSGL